MLYYALINRRIGGVCSKAAINYELSYYESKFGVLCDLCTLLLLMATLALRACDEGDWWSRKAAAVCMHLLIN